MKVLFLIDSLEGYGAEKSVVQIALNMKEVVPVFAHFCKPSGLKSTLVDAGIKVYSLHASGHRKILKLLGLIVQKEKPDVLHSTLFRSDMIARSLKRRYPSLLLVGSLVSNSYGFKRYSALSYMSRLKLFSTQIRDRLTASRVDYFICNSRAIMETNIRALGISRKKVFVLHRGRSFENISPSVDLVQRLTKEVAKGDQKVFLNISRLIKSKGQIDLLKSFKIFLKKYPDNLLIIVGEGPLRKDLTETINELGLEKKVFLLGYREDVFELLAVADYFVFTSIFEGLPGALIEAIIAKKPCIASNIPENRECFPEDGAIFFPPGDIKNLTSKLGEALNYQDWNKRVELSYEYAFKYFEITKISRAYEAFYKKIILKNSE